VTDNVFLQLGLALVLGLLVGLQRERTESSIAGFRTFPFITILGTLCGLLALRFEGWVVAAGLAAVTALLIVANLIRSRTGDVDPGITTEAAALLMFGVGASLAAGHAAAAVAVGGTVAVLLQLKKPMQSFAARVGEVDVTGIMQFVLVTLVVLPVLPNRAYGPWAVLNPFKIWLMVVLISGISLAAFLAQKLLGGHAGVLAGGLLGGLVSSTATTASYSRLGSQSPALRGLASSVIMLASATVYARMLIEIAAVASARFGTLAWPLFLMLAVSTLTGLIAYGLSSKEPAEIPQQENPAQLKSAVTFGALYAVVLLAAAATREYFGARGLLLVAVVSGLTDVDAITLSTAQLVQTGAYDAVTGRQAILIASLSNLVFKGGIVATLGGRDLLRRTGLLMAVVLVAGLVILLLSR
jgi:uncharacterized membrane protein (DUF4010 family)